MTTVIDIPLGKIEPDPNQPRKHFDEAKLQELAVSIQKHGVEQAIKVRPHPKKSVGHFMILFGERRWRASEIAGASSIPAIVEDVTDDASILERQIVENNQRDDIHPLEEGEVYQALHKKHGKSIEDLMAATGKSRSHVYARMKLTELAPAVKKAMLAGELPHAHGELIGRIPDAKLQEQCCREVLGDVKELRELQDLGVSHEKINEKEEQWGGKPQVLSFRATAALVRRRYQTKLSLAKFDPADPDLTKAGACGPCPERSGNQPELPGMPTVKGEDHCGNITCFAKKTDAAWLLAAAQAKASGLKVIEGKAASEVFYDSGQVKHDTKYASLKDELPWSIRTEGHTGTFGKMLGKLAADVPKVLVRTPDGGAVEMIDKDKAIEVLREAGKLKRPAKPSPQKTATKKKRAAEKEGAKLTQATFLRVVDQVVAAASKDLGNKEPAFWRWIATMVVDEFDYETHKMYADHRGLNHHDDAARIALKTSTKSTADMRAFVVELLLFKAADNIVGGYADELIDPVLKLFGVDWAKAEETTKLAAEHEAASLKASEAAKAEAKKAADVKKVAKKGGAK